MKKFVAVCMGIAMTLGLGLSACTVTEKQTYTVQFDTQGGSAVTSQQITEGSKAKKPVEPTKEGYTFLGWYVDDEAWFFHSGVVTENITLVAKWQKTVAYILTVTSSNAEWGTVTGGGRFGADGEETVTATPKKGYKFVGWFVGSEKISSEATYTFDVTADMDLVGRFQPETGGATSTVTAVSNNTAYGSVSFTGASTVFKGSEVTVTATAKSGYRFVGWYQGITLVSESAVYTMTVTEDIQLTAYFEGENGADSDVPVNMDMYTRVNKNGTENPTGDYLYFGQYPQSQVTDSALCSALNELYGDWKSYDYYVSGGNTTDYMWYDDVTYNGAEYRGVYFTSYRPSSTSGSATDTTYQTHNGYQAGTVYWFKYEPVQWRILSEGNGRATLLAELILDSQSYHNIGDSSNANNYAQSSIRAWLNDTFYQTAFTLSEQRIIQTTTVDNSVASSGYDSNAYACEDTLDKVYLLSYQEVVNSGYAFDTNGQAQDAMRQKKNSAYARIQGARTTVSNGNSFWWLRSSFNGNNRMARYVYDNGQVYYSDNVNTTSFGVIPALQIHL